MDKGIIRKNILEIRNKLSLEKRKNEDKSIYNKIIKSELYKNAKSIFTYVSFGSEVNTKELILKAIKDGKEVYVPKTYMDKKEMVAVNIHSLSELNVNNYGILEPEAVDKKNISNKFDLVIMPGVAFDKDGNRIGYGAGYYDKFIRFNKINANKVALSYNCQLVENIENESHDIKCDYIIMSKDVIKIKNS